jgi:hypothetical protein
MAVTASKNQSFASASSMARAQTAAYGRSSFLEGEWEWQWSSA